MGRKKKQNNFNLILMLAFLTGAAWIAADFWFNVYRPAQKSELLKTDSEKTAGIDKNTESKNDTLVPETENGFKTQTYRDDRYGIEFQYPVFAGNDAECPKLEKIQEGFFVGKFSFLASSQSGALNEYIDEQLQGMEVESRENIIVAGLNAVKADYQTQGMGWYGSFVYLAHDGYFFEFGLLANESAQKCAGIDDYEDRVYQSVISTLKFAD